MRNYILSLITVSFLFSCSSSNDVVSNRKISKRKYTKGLNLKYFSKNFNNDNKSNFKYNFQIFKESLAASSVSKNNDFLKASTNNNLDITIDPYIFKNQTSAEFSKGFDENMKDAKRIIRRSLFSKKKISDNEICDLIIFTDGNETSAKIIEITQYEIKYKLCDNLDGPLFTKSVSSVFKIKYANGTSQVMNSPSNDYYNSNNNNNSLGSLGGNISDDNIDKDSNYSQVLALGLIGLIFIGLFGVHRMYLGYWGIGILHLLTGGFCLIGTIVDLIKLLNGTLGPKNGDGWNEIL